MSPHKRHQEAMRAERAGEPEGPMPDDVPPPAPEPAPVRGPAYCSYPTCPGLGTYRRLDDGARLCNRHAGPLMKGWGTPRAVHDPGGLSRADVAAFMASPAPSHGERGRCI